MPRKVKKCPDCLDKGYLSVLGIRRADPRQLMPCTCRHGRRFDRMWRKESPPTKP